MNPERKSGEQRLAIVVILVCCTIALAPAAAKARSQPKRANSSNPRTKKPGSPGPRRAARPTGNQNKKETTVDFNRNARVTLGDGRTIEGVISFKAPEKLTVEHAKKGITYRRVVRVADIQSIENRKWKSSFVRRNKEGEVFRFNVAEFDLILEDHVRLSLNRALYPFLSRFRLKNRNGQVLLFTFWIDLLRRDGSWYTGLPASGGNQRRDCHRDAVKRIDFISEPQSDSQNE